MNTEGLQVLLDLKEQINMIASGEERCLLPNFCIVVIKFISRELLFKLL